ncbi:distal membrane-arm assembly complex protein 2 [Culicoides brevitarsis]|uniref:distal membrane-arm assembly complex protein 2 n=1 Tax=Culicoides brevitarsis TaxID=469753 RepID=UPI00307CBAE1
MLTNSRILSSQKLWSTFCRSFGSQQGKPRETLKKDEVFELDVKPTKGEKESWDGANVKEEVKVLTPRERKMEEDRKRLKWAKLPDEKNLFRSKFASFNKNENDMGWLTFVSQPWDFSISGIRKAINDWAIQRDKYLQQYLPKRVEVLGPDLAVAHFLCTRRGKVRFAGDTEWITSETLKDIPNVFDPKYHLEEIDTQDCFLYYEGIQNFRDLEYCKKISIRNSPHFDDWCMDSISGANLPALEELDLRGCTKLTFRSLACIYRLEKLKKLLLTINSNIEWKLTMAMLEEANPNLEIVVEEVENKVLEDKK